MYKLHLILKYLRKRRIAWVSLIAVTLCTAMVLVVISVMGGWLRMFRTSFHGLSGDILVQAGSLTGFPYYQDIIREAEKLPEVEAAIPVIQTFGLININARKTMGVQVLGYPIDRIGRVNEFPASLWRQCNQWLEWADGAPISIDDRRELRDVYQLDVRAGTSLLGLTRSEKEKLKESIPKAQNLLDKATGELNRAKDPAAREELIRQVDEVQIVARAVKELAGVPEQTAAQPFERMLIRKHLGNVVDDPDQRLAPDDREKKLVVEQGKKLAAHPSFKLFLPPEEYKAAFRVANPKAKPVMVEESATWDGMIAGTGVVNIRKDRQGRMINREDFLYRIPVALTVMGVSPTGKFDLSSKAERNYWIVDTSRTKVWQYDSNTIYVPFGVLQSDLGMGPQEAQQDGKTITIPARTSEVHIRLRKPWGDSSQNMMVMRDRIQSAVDQVMAKKVSEGEALVGSPLVRTWEQSQATWLGAIEKEKVLVTFLFGMISVVAIFLIFCIFYMIVVEKTRDIGIIKSVGATSSGVAGIFLGYGAAIGIVGAGLGLLFGYLIVHNINELHEWLGRAMHVQIWDPQVYAFDTIPNTMDPTEVTVIVAVAIISSILGALVPAIRAARLNPVEALRWE